MNGVVGEYPSVSPACVEMVPTLNIIMAARSMIFMVILLLGQR
jgi:hypothetical protein